MSSNGGFDSLMNDLCFKYVFSKEYILKDFINAFFRYLNLDEEFYFTEIIPQKYIMPNKKEHLGYYGDLIAVISNDTIISLELYSNKNFSKMHYNKSYAYMCRLFDNNIENTITYNCKKIISLNLMNGNFRKANPRIVNKHRLINLFNGRLSDDGNTALYLVRLDKLKDIQYTLNEERFIKWLRLINAKTLENMISIGRNDRIMEEAIEFVKRWNRESAKDGLENMIKFKQAEAYVEALEIGHKDGALDTKIEIANNMLKDGYSVKDIAKITKLSFKDIKALKEKI